MKILHICLTGIFTEGFSYQENMLVKYHRLAGYEVEVAASAVVRDRFSPETYLAAVETLIG